MMSWLLVFAAAVWSETEIPQFRGPAGDGHLPGVTGLPTEWSETSNVAWKSAIPGRGWS